MDANWQDVARLLKQVRYPGLSSSLACPSLTVQYQLLYVREIEQHGVCTVYR